jgi:transcriptional regulator with XRE-family HTH domain
MLKYPIYKEIDSGRSRSIYKDTDIDRSNFIYKIIGYRITKKRLEKKLNQKELSERVGMSRTSITLIELGKQKLPIDRLYKIAEALETEPFFFFPDVEEIYGSKKISDKFFTEEEEKQINEILISYKIYKKSFNNLLNTCE